MWLQKANPQGDPFSLSAPNSLHFRERNRSFSQLVAFSVRGRTLVGSGDLVQATGMPVSAGFFEMLRVQPEMGRGFASDEFPIGADGEVVVVTRAFWETQLGATSAALGSTVSLDGSPRTVIGVMAADFRSPARVDLWIPFEPDPGYDRNAHQIEAVGRLAPGATIKEARRDLRGITAGLAGEFSASNDGCGTRLRTFPEWMIGPDVRRTVVVLLGAVRLLLLLACANYSWLVPFGAQGKSPPELLWGQDEAGS